MTGDEHALVQAIIAAPDDDLPRLVYADWLDENDRPERAEIIRVECELAKLFIRDPATDLRAKELKARGQALFGLRRQWQDDIRISLPPNRLTHVYFKRGMVSIAWCTTKYFATNAAAMFAAAPIRSVQLTRPTTKGIDAVTSTPEWNRLSGLHLDADEVSADVLRSIMDRAPEQLRTLKVYSSTGNARPPNTWIDRSGALVRAIAEARRLTGLERLSLMNAGVGNDGGEALADSPWLANLKTLVLTGNPLTDRVQDRLRDRFGSCVYFDYDDYVGRLRYGDLP